MGSLSTIRFWAFCFAIIMFGLVAVMTPAILMRAVTARYIYTDINALPHEDVGLVLGASVMHGKPSPALASRTEEAAEVFKSGKVDTLLVTGAVEPNYNEITPMRQYLLNAGIPQADISSDSEGFDTYSSVYRAKNVFLTNSLVIVSQDFHLPRALFIAHAMHIQAYGLVAPRGARLYDYLREIPASWKAIFDLATGRVPQDSDILAPIVIPGISA